MRDLLTRSAILLPALAAAVVLATKAVTAAHDAPHYGEAALMVPSMYLVTALMIVVTAHRFAARLCDGGAGADLLA